MFYVHSFQTDGSYRIGGDATLVGKDLTTIRGVIRRTEASYLDTRLGYDIVQVPDSSPYTEGKIVFRSNRALQLFGTARQTRS